MFDYLEPIVKIFDRLIRTDPERESTDMVNKKTKPKRGGYSGTPRKRAPAILIGYTAEQRAEWRRRVNERLVLLGWRSVGNDGKVQVTGYTRLSDESGVGKSTVHELMNGDAESCADLQKIHDALGWTLQPPLLAEHEEEMLRFYRKLTPREQGEWNGIVKTRAVRAGII